MTGLWLLAMLAQAGADEAAMFGDAPPPVVTPIPTITEDPMAIGGKLRLRFETIIFEDTDRGDQPLSAPHQLDVYLDARPTERLRAFAQVRTTYTPAVIDATTGEANDETDVALDQLWLKFDIAHRAFATVGVQPVKWGAGRIWNPTDFVNQSRRNPLQSVDLRMGVPLARLELPIEALNGSVQVMALLDEADTLGDVGGAARFTGAWGATELTLSAATRVGSPLHLGGDLSTALGPIDVYAEAAVAHGHASALPTEESRDDDWIPQAVVGLEWPLRYGDQDTFYLGAEYFYNDAGHDDPDVYPLLFALGELTPFYLGRHYGALYAVLPAPGDWNDSTFLLTVLANASDETGVARLQLSQKVLTQLTVEPYVSASFGEAGGELRYSLDVPAIGGEPAIHIPPPMAEVGLWLTLAL